jgi:hypothetical protein
MDKFKKIIAKMLPAGGAGNNGYKSRCNCCGIPQHWPEGGKYRQLARRKARRIFKKQIEE